MLLSVCGISATEYGRHIDGQIQSHKIDEPDYGCEGLPEGAVRKDMVMLFLLIPGSESCGCLMIICMIMTSMKAIRYALKAGILSKRYNDG